MLAAMAVLAAYITGYIAWRTCIAHRADPILAPRLLIDPELTRDRWLARLYRPMLAVDAWTTGARPVWVGIESIEPLQPGFDDHAPGPR